MQRQTYTQEDLKQVLQRVIIEKRPVPLIKKEIPPEKEIPPVMIQETIIQEAVVKESLLPIMPMARAANEVSNPTQIHKESSDKDSQIALLKTIIKELAGKEKTKNEERPVPLEHSLALAHDELAMAKKRSRELEEALSRLDRTKSLLVEQLKEQSAKFDGFELLKNENSRFKVAVKELTQALAQSRSLLHSKEEKSLTGAKEDKAELEQELHEHKRRSLRFICDKRELEETISSLSNEKATLLARLRDITQKNSSRETLLEELSSKQQALLDSLQEKEASLGTLQKLFDDTAAQKKELIEQVSLLHKNLQESSSQAAEAREKMRSLSDEFERDKRAYQQELAVCQACVVEKQQSLEEEHKRHRLLAQNHELVFKRSQEQEQHLKLLEQHLARRIKECAVLAKQLEEHATKQASLQQIHLEQVQKIEKAEADLAQAKESQATLQKELSSIQQNHDVLFTSSQAQAHEILVLKKMKERLIQLEQLFSQFGQVLSQPVAQLSAGALAPKIANPPFE